VNEVMIAYNHYIDFVPKLENEKNVAGSFAHIMTVKESSIFDFHEKFQYRLKYFNNQGRDISLYTEREFSCTEKGQLWAFEVEDVMVFFWESGTETLRYIPHKKFTSRLLEYWALHIVLPIFFTVEEKYDFLHAGAVEVEGKPILFVAESFGGKSTMTDYFLKKGHMLVSDDKVATYEVDGKFICTASIPFHRPYRKLEDLGYFVENIAHTPKPIHAIYELDRSEANAEIGITELSGIEKFKALRYSSEYNLSFLKTKRFAYLTRLAKAVPVYKVTVPWDLDRLDEVYKIIIMHTSTK